MNTRPRETRSEDTARSKLATSDKRRFLPSAKGLWEHIADRLLVKRWGTVVPGLIYRSGQLCTGTIERTLRRYGIRVIINLRGRRGSSAEHIRETEVARALNIRLVCLPLKGDGTGDLRHYSQAIQHMVAAEREQSPLLVHCAAGAQRTGGVVAAYRLLIQRASPDFVFDEMRRHAWKPKKDVALLHYLNKNMADLARMLVEAGVIDAVPNPLPRLDPTKPTTRRLGLPFFF